MSNRSVSPPWSTDTVIAVSQVLGDNDRGLTGTEIGIVLGASTIRDVDGPGQTKWKRIYNALATRQNKDKSANCVIRVITEAMKPVRYRDDPAQFSELQTKLNEVLIYLGLRVTETGSVSRVPSGKARTLAEATERAGATLTELRRRGAHSEVLKYCRAELFQKNNFHAVFEASKSVPDRLRTMTGLTEDGAALVQKTLFPKVSPLVAINEGNNETDYSEQGGFGNLVEGLLGMYRNTTAHSPKINRDMTEEELLECFTTLSMVHRRLDFAKIRNKR